MKKASSLWVAVILGWAFFSSGAPYVPAVQPQVDYGPYHTVGLKSDGTLVAVGNVPSAKSLVIAGWYLSSIIPTPIAPAIILLPTSDSAVINSDPEKIMPVGVGLFASCGGTLKFKVKLGAFVDPVDLYFAVFIPDLGPIYIYALKPDMIFQTHQDEIIPWKNNVTVSTNETLFGEIPISGLPVSTYYVYLASKQTGKDSLLMETYAVF